MLSMPLLSSKGAYDLMSTCAGTVQCMFSFGIDILLQIGWFYIVSLFIFCIGGYAEYNIAALKDDNLPYILSSVLCSDMSV